MPGRIAVLTGDVIDSRKVGDRPRLYRRLEATLAELASRHGGHGERFRGDGFQLALPRSVSAMEAAVVLRAALIEHSEPHQRWDARIAVAVGPGEPGGREADGETFIASGRRLDALAGGAGHLSLTLLDESEDPALDLLMRFLDDLLGSWSPYAAEVVGLNLGANAARPPSQQALADRLGISQPSVHKRLKAARWPLLADTLAYLRGRLDDRARSTSGPRP